MAKKAKVRTAAERSRAAKLAWELRRKRERERSPASIAGVFMQQAQHRPPVGSFSPEWERTLATSGVKQYANDTLNQRERTHGDYGMTAKTAQQLKRIIRSEGSHLSEEMQESLDMIAVKIARILSGNSSEMDHWRDIIGYASLIVERNYASLIVERNA